MENIDRNLPPERLPEKRALDTGKERLSDIEAKVQDLMDLLPMASDESNVQKQLTAAVEYIEGHREELIKKAKDKALYLRPEDYGEGDAGKKGQYLKANIQVNPDGMIYLIPNVPDLISRIGLVRTAIEMKPGTDKPRLVAYVNKPGEEKKEMDRVDQEVKQLNKILSGEEKEKVTDIFFNRMDHLEKKEVKTVIPYASETLEKDIQFDKEEITKNILAVLKSKVEDRESTQRFLQKVIQLDLEQYLSVLPECLNRHGCMNFMNNSDYFLSDNKETNEKIMKAAVSAGSIWGMFGALDSLIKFAEDQPDDFKKEIAKEIMQQDFKHYSDKSWIKIIEFTSRCGFEERVVKDFALKLVEQDSYKLIESINKLSLKEDESKYEIVMKMVTSAPQVYAKERLIEYVFKNFDNFDFQKEETWTQVISDLVENNNTAEMFVNNIDKFGEDFNHIVNKTVLKMVENKKTFETNYIMRKVETFKPDKKQFFSDFVKELMETDEGSKVLTKNIEKFGLNEEELKKIYGLMLEKYPQIHNELIKNINKFVFEDQIKHDIIIKLARNPRDSQNISYLIREIYNERPIDEIITSIFLNDEKELNCVVNIFKIIEEVVEELEDGDDKDYLSGQLNILKSCFSFSGDIKEQRESFDPAYKNIINKNKSLIKEIKLGRKNPIQSNLEKLKNLRVGTEFLRQRIKDCSKSDYSKSQLDWLIYTTANFAQAPEEFQEQILSTNILKACFDVHIEETSIRIEFTEKFFNHSKRFMDNPKQYSAFFNRFSSKWASPVALTLMDWEEKGISIGEEFEKTLEEPRKQRKVKKELKKDVPVQYKRNVFLKDLDNTLLLTNGLNGLLDSPIDNDVKSTILDYLSLLTDKELKVELQSINLLLNANKNNEVEFLNLLSEIVENFEKEILSDKTRDFFFSRIEKIASKTLNLPDTTDMEKINEILCDSNRLPEVLYIYVVNLLNLNDENEVNDLLDIIRKFLIDVSSDTFKTNRYEGSKHLNKIFEAQDGIKEKWVENREKPLSHYDPKTKTKDWSIIIGDDPLDLLLSGTEVRDSCQNVSGNPIYNKALMGYVMDGKHRILAVKDKQGKIKSRLILRLMWDADNKKPCLFFETVYPKTTKKSIRDAMKTSAIEYARDLGVDVYSCETESDKMSFCKLMSLSSKAPFEYCDAARGIQTGAFRIDAAFKIFSYDPAFTGEIA